MGSLPPTPITNITPVLGRPSNEDSHKCWSLSTPTWGLPILLFRMSSLPPWTHLSLFQGSQTLIWSQSWSVQIYSFPTHLAPPHHTAKSSACCIYHSRQLRKEETSNDKRATFAFRRRVAMCPLMQGSASKQNWQIDTDNCINLHLCGEHWPHIQQSANIMLWSCAEQRDWYCGRCYQ
jgi:hypothetical protein